MRAGTGAEASVEADANDGRQRRSWVRGGRWLNMVICFVFLQFSVIKSTSIFKR